jgi:hypothetical protein
MCPACLAVGLPCVPDRGSLDPEHGDSYGVGTWQHVTHDGHAGERSTVTFSPSRLLYRMRAMTPRHRPRRPLGGDDERLLIEAAKADSRRFGEL